jgi:membrane protein YqaA with SNARE-associated domain
MPYSANHVFTVSSSEKAYQFTLICTALSVLGGVVGYFLGALLIDVIQPLLVKLHYIDKLETVKTWFAEYGIWIVALAGFSPMPYKIFTLGAGIANMALSVCFFINLSINSLTFWLRDDRKAVKIYIFLTR